MDQAELDADKAIDPEQLDVEWVENAERFHKWAHRAVAAEAKADLLEFDAGVLKDKLALSCRADPKEFGLEKVTEEAVKAAVNTHPEYNTAYRAYLAARAEHMALKAATMAMDKKERALVNLVTLHGQEYFAGPSVPHDLMAAWEMHRRKGTDYVDGKTPVRRRVRLDGGDNA